MQLSPENLPDVVQSLASTRGFLLTRNAADRNNHLEITLWLKTPQGPVQLIIDNERAVFFVEVSDVTHVKDILAKQGINLDEIKTLALKAFNQAAVAAVYFLTLRDFYQARAVLKQKGIKCYEDDIRPDDRFLMERFITADLTFAGQAVNLTSANNQAYQRFEQVKCKRIDKAQQTDIALSSVSLDIECSMSGELYSIGLYSEHCQQVLMIANAEEIAREQQATRDVDIVWQANEQELLVSLLAWFTQHDPDIIMGWNVINFDFALLQNRYDLYGLKFTIGRDKKAPHWRKNQSSEQQFIEINGRVVLDGIDLLKSATYNFPSFSLDNVANTLLGIGKKVDDVDHRIQEITNNFHHDKTALAIYNLEDCRLVLLIFQHTQLLEFAMLRAQLTGLAIDRIGGSVAAFTNLYLPKLHRSGYIAPNMGDGDQGFESPGGFVMDSTPGLYKNVLVLDFKSLYPSIIRSFNIDPMGLIEGLKSPETAIEGFDGAYFSREQHFLPDIITELWKERDIAKRDNNAALSQAIKIIMNSFYGVLGSNGCRFFDPRLSGSITKRSHSILKTTKSWIEAKGYQVIYGDTDSIFVHVGDHQSAEQSRALGKILQDYINQKWQKLLKEQFNIVSELDIEFETHFSQFLMPTIRGQDIGTKKRYAGLVQKGEQQQLVFKGLESVRTDWTELAKQFQRTLYLKIFNNEPVADYIKQMVADTLAGKHDDLLYYRKRLRRKLELYVKNVPPHVRAARLADEIYQQQGKPLKYQNKGWIEYLMTTNGPQAKGCQSAALDYQFYIDRQLLAVADAILPFINTSFDEITNSQMSLFER
ncbi:DNA polymerase II [Colwellia sp. MB02u-18]|uniref:DNA polymerase II n=1 Tax=unclassified Colwellia TaxID=196834 RepID=UPI0015F495A8|nr:MULTISPECIES: DNA polymerase II [unclassified Colwellia]MBA6225300.1 DNA polymerase II [Colwellia sp. MB3u-45]MBA6267250.1 DNA polymerase II [Colwellia sp. MB3u-43]MBA6322862.1 DNA polymerase II [Colwellia sp. MB02u-19]MBA6324730.1 DNA polymerase II [Colwellia sp. MB02u-18]MBA6331079.1 DNA polymerase II [Colwellia sp. MB02u-12]